MAHAESEAVTDSDRRAILTDREREIISDEADVSDAYRYQTVSRVRKRFERLEGDLEAFAAHGDLLDDFRAVACPDDLGDASGQHEQDERHATPDQHDHTAADRATTGQDAVEQHVENEYDVGDATREYLQGEKPSWSDERRTEAAEAVVAAVNYLKEHESGQKRDFISDVRPDHPGGFAPIDPDESGEKRDRSGWWRHVVRPMLNEHPDVTERGQVYQWRDEGQ